MMDSRVFGAIGLSMKAGKCVSGEFAVDKALQKGNVQLLVLDTETSELTKKKFKDASLYKNIGLVYVENAGSAIGKPERKILGITDSNFKNMVLKALNQDSNN